MGFWSKIKKAAKKTWNAVKATVRTVVKIVSEVVFRVVNFVLVWLPVKKKMRIVVLILRDENGVELISESNKDLIAAIEYAKKTFNDRMDISLKPFGTMIQTLKDSAPTAALEVGCDSSARGVGIAIAGAAVLGAVGILGGPVGVGIGIAVGFGIGSALSGAVSGGALHNEFTEAGAYYAKNTAGSGWLRMNLQFPITIFIVRDITGKIGCSLGPLTDYVTLSIKGVASESTLAHEIGHCCGLLHRDDTPDNLMYPQGSRTDNKVTGWQKFAVRNCRHCTFW
jgi:hypothetical protein